MIYGRTLLAAGLACAAFTASAQIYRWIDQQGKLHVSDTPPTSGAKNVERQESAVVPQVGPGEPYALQLARKNAPVKLYTAPGCEPCSTARELLNSRGIPFEEVSVVDDKAFEDLKTAVGGGAVPSLVVGGSVQQGFEERTYHRILDAAGYPKTGVLPVRAQQEPKAPVTESAAAEPEPEPLGPYAPGAPRQRQRQRQRQPKK
jgi:glutaredoxin